MHNSYASISTNTNVHVIILPHTAYNNNLPAMHSACFLNKTCNQYVKYLMTIYVSTVSPQPIIMNERKWPKD